jgi:hypothetical protein
MVVVSDPHAEDPSLTLTGFEDDTTKNLVLARRYLARGPLPTLKPILPLLLQLKGQPYRLDDYFPFEPFFKTTVPKSILLKTGRQVSKSTSLAAQGIVSSASLPYFSTLYVTPLFEMVRRFSHNYVREFLEQSPVRKLFVSQKTLNNVLQRTFVNGSTMYFSYAFLDANRTRGIPADRRVADEIQDLQYDFLQIIDETLSGSKYGLRQSSGTPKSLDNTIEKVWQDSSQAEWVTKCREAGCGHYNVPALSHDLWDMIGPWRADITEKEPGLVCAKCGKPLAPKTGRWLHAFPDRQMTNAGYHIPQQIMPMHYGSPEKWGELVGKQAGKGNTTTTTFLNEVCGESSDFGSKLVTETDLKAACVLPWKRRGAPGAKHIRRYTHRVLAVDWGGGGGRVSNTIKKTGEQARVRTSYTTLAVLGITGDGKIDVIWGHRSLRTHDFLYEAKLCVEAIGRFECSHLVHDFSDAGEGRLVLLYQAGLGSVVNMRYQGHGHNIINYHAPTDDQPHGWYAVHKSRSLVVTCLAIKHGLIRFFEYDYVNADDTGVVRDFLALVEEKVDSRVGTDVYVIVRNPNQSDDFAQSVNYGAVALWHMTGRWPNIAESAKMVIPKAVMKHLHPTAKVDWNDLT